jgi:hypothetical protein
LGGRFLTVYLNKSTSVLEVVVVVAVVVDAAGLGVAEDAVVDALEDAGNDALEDAGVDALEDVGVDATTGATWIFRSSGFLVFLGIVLGGWPFWEASLALKLVRDMVFGMAVSGRMPSSVDCTLVYALVMRTGD